MTQKSKDLLKRSFTSQFQRREEKYKKIKNHKNLLNNNKKYSTFNKNKDLLKKAVLLINSDAEKQNTKKFKITRNCAGICFR